MAYFYITALSVEVAYKLSNPLIISYKRRLIFYHIACWTSGVLSLAGLLIVGEPGSSIMGTCFIYSKSPGTIFLLVPNVILICIVLISLGISIRKMVKIKSDIYINHILTVLTFALPYACIMTIGYLVSTGRFN